MTRHLAVIVGGLLFAAFLLLSSTFTVKYNEVAIRATFGSVDEESVIRDAGLHFRWPIFIDRVDKLDTRLQVIESPLEETPTADGLQVVARGFLFWRVAAEGSGPLDFAGKYETIDGAANALQSLFRTQFAAGMGAYPFDQLIGPANRLAEAEDRIRRAMEAETADGGVEIVSVGVSQLMLPPRTARAVVERMEAERRSLAEAENRKGQAARQNLIAAANTDADKIRSFANRRAREIEGAAARYAKELLEGMRGNQELAIFLAWLDTLEASLTSRTTIILPSDIAPWHMLDQSAAGDRSEVIPQPERGARAEPGGSAPVAGIEGESVAVAERNPSDTGEGD